MACADDALPVTNNYCWFVYSVNEEVIFWVDENGDPTPITEYTGSLFRFRAGRKLGSTILLDVIGTIEDRLDPDDNVIKPAVVIVLTPEDKEHLLLNQNDADRNGTIYLTSTLKETPIIHGVHTIQGGA